MPGPDVLLARYEIGELIGAGGSARVYRAHDRTLDRQVAVKVLDSAVARSADPASHARFLREARSSARFSHPNAVAVYDAGDDADRLFIVMEYVDGTSLAHRIANDAPIADRHVARVGTQLLSALGAAHAAGLVHRDVKPANVLIDGSGTVKLADFGIARRFDEITSALTMEGMVMGTRAYLAPEQARGDDVGPATDLYAVGAVLYEMATGERPPMTPAAAERGADPRQLVPGLAPAVAAAISRALAGRPDARFASAAEMSAALTSPATSPVRAAAAATPPPMQTSVMPARRAAATSVMPASRPAPPARDRGRWWIVPVVALLVVAGIVTALALTESPETQFSDDIATDPSAATGAATTPAATTAPTEPTSPATTEATSTVPPTTPPPTTSPATSPPTTVAPDELIPGFPATDDIDQFIDQLRASKSPAGKQAKKLGDGLSDVLKADDDRGEEIDDLVEKMAEWVEKEELDPVVASRAFIFLDDLDDRSA